MVPVQWLSRQENKGKRMTEKNILEELHRVISLGRVLDMEPMSRHTTFRVGGAAEYFVEPANLEEVRGVLQLSQAYGLPVFVLGNGSNLLVRDGGIRGIVLHLGKLFQKIWVQGTEVTAQAGALLSTVAATALNNSLTGLEFAAGIPGSMGGALRMNAGAYGGEMKQVVTSADCLTRQGDLVTLSVEELQLGYRHSLLTESDLLVVSVSMKLAKGNRQQIQETMQDLAARRLGKQPLEFPSAGSTFKRPEGYFAGKLIMDAGLAGKRVGDAVVSPKHCGFVVNAGGAKAREIEELVAEVQREVWQQFQVRLEPEIIMVGEEA